MYFWLFTLSQKKTNCNPVLLIHTSDYLLCFRRNQIKLQLLYCSLAVYLLLFSASYYLHNRITASEVRYRRSVCIEYQSAIRTICGSGLLRHGLNFSTAWCTKRLISGKKTISMYQCRRWSLWTLAVTLLAWHSSCHISEPVFQSHTCQPTTGSFQSHQHWRNTTYLQSDEKVSHFTSQCGDIFRWGGQVGYSLFSSQII